jgi:hypothetical protein
MLMCFSCLQRYSGLSEGYGYVLLSNTSHGCHHENAAISVTATKKLPSFICFNLIIIVASPSIALYRHNSFDVRIADARSCPQGVRHKQHNLKKKKKQEVVLQAS